MYKLLRYLLSLLVLYVALEAVWSQQYLDLPKKNYVPNTNLFFLCYMVIDFFFVLLFSI